MSMFNDIDWSKGMNVENCMSSGILKRKKGEETIHLNGVSTNTELLFQTIHYVNQLSTYGTVANWCQQFGLTEEEKKRDEPIYLWTRRC